MASQPEGEEDEVHRLVVGDDRQPRVDYGDIDKGHEIVGVPIALDSVIDEAVNLIRKVYQRKVDVDLETIVEYIDIYLRRRQQGDTVTVEDDFIQPLNNFVSRVRLYYASVASNSSESSDVVSILNQYCEKVKGVIAGCLIATIQLTDDAHLSLLVSALDLLSSQLRKLLIGGNKIVVSTNIPGVPERVRRIVPQLMEAITYRVRLEISMEKGEMLNFLEQETNEIKLTILTRIYSPDPESCTQDRKVEFLEGFAGYKHTFKKIQELFSMSSSERKMAQLSVSDPEYELVKGLETEKMGSGAEGKDPESGTRRREVYRGPLSPPQAPEKDEPEERPRSSTSIYIKGLPEETTDRTLFDLFKDYGTLLYICTPIDSLTDRSRGYGFVKFADSEDAKKALDGLHDKEINMALEDNAPDLEESKITIKELSPTTTESELHKLCEGCGDILKAYMIPSRDFGFVKFNTRSAAVKALKELQSRNKLAVMATVKRFAI